MSAASKAVAGNFFEDFRVGQELRHATPRTVTAGDVALYLGLYGARFAVQSSDAFARTLGLEASPVDDLLAFHIVFGKTVPDVSLNAVANLGYANCRFGAPVQIGDTLSTVSTVIGLKQNSTGKTGTVYVRSVGRNQRDEVVLDYVRWVMVHKRDPGAPAPAAVVPDLADAVAAVDLAVPAGLDLGAYDDVLAGSAHRWGDYQAGEKIDHVDGVTIESAEHMLATRLYQNTARPHFNQHLAQDTRFAQRLVYGGHVISIVRAQSFNGLGNAFKLAAINGGSHVAPAFAGDTIYSWTEVLARIELPGRNDIGALRLRTLGVKNRACADFPHRGADGKYDPALVLDLDYTVLIPR